MEEQTAIGKSSIGKVASLVLMTCLFIWQGILAYLVYEISRLFTDMETPSNMIVFIAWTQPFIWLFMFLTVLAIYDIIRRRNFLVLNTIALISIIAVANVFLQILVVLAGYAPIFELGNTSSG